MVGCAAPMMCSRSHFHIVWQDEKTICKVEDDSNKQKAQARGNEALHLRCDATYCPPRTVSYLRISQHVSFSSGPARFWSRPHQNKPDFSDESEQARQFSS